MRSKAMPKWMSNEMERLSMKLERYKPACSGYNRIQPILLSRSVTHMLNNPLPVEDQIGNIATTTVAPTATVKPDQVHHQPHQQTAKSKGVLSRSESEWEEVYPTVNITHATSPESNKFAYYRNCSTRIT